MSHLDAGRTPVVLRMPRARTTRSCVLPFALRCLVLLGIAGAATAAPLAEPEILHYRFDEAGTTVTNHASTPPVGTETGAIIGGTFAQGVPFNGFLDALTANGSASSNGDFVDSHWVTNLSGAFTISFLTSDVPPSATLYYIFGDASAGQLRCFTNGVAGPNNWILRGPFTDVLITDVATTAPHLVTFVYNPASSDIKGYRDGVLVTTVPQGAISISGMGPFKVGGYSANVGLNGKMADFRIYSRALDDAEIADLYTYATLETPMTVEVTQHDDATCHGAADGALGVTPSGGLGPYTYAWAPTGGTDAIATGLPAGSYTATVTDDFGQTTTASADVGEPPAIVFDTVALPGGAQDMPYSGSVAASGGTGTINYTVSAGALPPGVDLAADGTLSGTPTASGVFNVTVSATDANTCLADQAYSITIDTSLAATVTAQTGVSCNGGADGTLTVTPSGGQPPYTYSWAPTGGTGATAIGLVAGSYTVTVTDGASNTTTATADVTEPTAIVFGASSLPQAFVDAPYIGTLAAIGGTGTIALSVSQGALPPGLALDPDGLVSGLPTTTGSFAFDARATDANSCTADASYSIDVIDNPDRIFDDGFDG